MVLILFVFVSMFGIKSSFEVRSMFSMGIRKRFRGMVLFTGALGII